MISRKGESRSALPALGFIVSVAIVAWLPWVNIRSELGAEQMVLYSVRCALPLFLVAFTASSMVVLAPNSLCRWILRQRRAFGLAFAVGMSWHLAAVAYYLASFRVHINARDLYVDLVGVACLIALAATSFRIVNRHLSLRTWQRTHRTGMYGIWLITIYIYAIRLKNGSNAADVIAMTMLLTAGLIRGIARRRRRLHGRANKWSAGQRGY